MHVHTNGQTFGFVMTLSRSRPNKQQKAWNKPDSGRCVLSERVPLLATTRRCNSGLCLRTQHQRIPVPTWTVSVTAKFIMAYINTMSRCTWINATSVNSPVVQRFLTHWPWTKSGPWQGMWWAALKSQNSTEKLDNFTGLQILKINFPVDYLIIK